MDLANQLMDDMKKCMAEKGCSRAVMVWNASTEAYHKPCEIHETLEAFEKALNDNHPEVAPSQIYAYAALKMGFPYINGAPNYTVDIKAIQELAEKNNVPIAGKDWKTGQTLMKTILAPGFKTRMLVLSGWFSQTFWATAIEILDDPANFKSKEVSKLSALDTIPSRKLPDLTASSITKSVSTTIRRERRKRSMGQHRYFRWLEMPMQIKVTLCRDSILAAPSFLTQFFS